MITILEFPRQTGEANPVRPQMLTKKQVVYLQIWHDILKPSCGTCRTFSGCWKL